MNKKEITITIDFEEYEVLQAFNKFRNCVVENGYRYERLNLTTYSRNYEIEFEWKGISKPLKDMEK